MASLLQWWNEWEIQLMVFLSFMLQLFLFLTGRLRLQSINSLLRVSIWLAYVGEDLVAVYALGLFSQYEEKYMLGKNSFGDTLPFLWVPFLIVHLGGQDSITAFSIEDNNLWLRHLLNLGIQGTLALYVLWKSVDRINSQVLITAAFVFVSGIIKYGERTWALRTGSRDGLGKSSIKSSKREVEEESPGQSNRNHIYPSWARASYALQTVLLARGLFVGRTVLQLGDGVQQKFENYFKTHGEVEEKLKIVVMELGMMFDLLYTKSMVLQRRIGCIYRCATQISMVAAFVLFLQTEKHAHNHNRVNIAISYTLFIGAIFMESCSVATVIASPWTWAHLKEGSFLQRLSSCSNAFSQFKAIQHNNMQWLSPNFSIGQFNHIDFSISHASTPKVTCKVISTLGLGRQWKNLRHLKCVEAKGIVEYIVKWFDRSPTERFGQLQLGRRLNYTLCVPFEHALYRLHIYTDLHISRHFDDPGRSGHAADVMLLKEQCEKLSNYMMYLKERYPSMLPVSSTVDDGELEPEPDKWKRNCGRRKILEEDNAIVLYNESEPDSANPFEPTPESESDWTRSLEEIREMWIRLLVYSAGKCGGELHARQLGNGVELITFVWLLMLHHGLGDAATEVKLLTSDDPSLPELGSVVAAAGSNWGPRPEQPRYAFDFRHQQHSPQAEAGMSRERELQPARVMQQVVPELIASEGNVVHIPISSSTLCRVR